MGKRGLPQGERQRAPGRRLQRDLEQEVLTYSVLNVIEVCMRVLPTDVREILQQALDDAPQELVITDRQYLQYLNSICKTLLTDDQKRSLIAELDVIRIERTGETHQ